MAYRIADWRKTHQWTDRLHEMLKVPDGSVTPIGIVYRNDRGEINAHIEVLGPEFYSAKIGGVETTDYGDNGLRRLEELMWNEMMETT